jgi:DnaK suppressor protein
MPKKSSGTPRKAVEKKLPPKEAPPKISSPFGAADLKEFKTLLLNRKRQLEGDVTHMKDEALKKGVDSGDLSSLPMHIADQGTDSFEQEMTLGFMETEGEELKEIDEALLRIKDDRYGVCESCFKSIPKARLEAIPYARLCVPCKRKEDGE